MGPASPGLLRYVMAAINKISLQLFGKRIDYRHSAVYSRAFGRLFRRRLRRRNYDLVLVCGSTECGAWLDTPLPVVYVLDRTIAGALNYHTILSDLWPFSAQQSVETDKKAMEEAAALLFSSRWAANHAHQLYGIPYSKIHVLPFGANLDHLPERSVALRQKDTTQWRLLLVGTYWNNKGADIAFAALKHLLAGGVNASLTVVGCIPPQPIDHPNLHIIPFVNKNTQEGLAQLDELFRTHHFFILPTRFDCTPIVFCEASAYAMPILSSDTGGVAGHVREGVNGFLLPYDDQGRAYAECIMNIISVPGAYENLAATTRDHFEEYLNWKVWAREFGPIADAVTPD